MQRLHRFEPRKNNKQQHDSWTPAELPLDFLVAIYARRSDPTAIKKLNTSNEMQTSDLVDFAIRLGWTEEKIIVIDQDMGLSGRLRIDQREGLRGIIAMIAGEDEEGKGDNNKKRVRAVIVQLEDRLFRDETQIQVNVFIDICRRHSCLVITPHMTYDFTNRFHVKQFRWRCEEAADYLKDYVQTRLVEGKHRVARRGDYVGGGTPPGFIVDKRETIHVDGLEIKNPTYRKYVIYKPHADIVIWLYDRYMMLSGNLTKLCNELRAMPVLFSDFPPELEQHYTAKLQLRRVPGGYHVTKRGLISILTNVAYLGWWVYQGQTISKTNHSAIVAEDVFWYAFNHLSAYTVTGDKNEQVSRPPRYHQTRGEEAQALLKDIISTEYLGSVYVVPAQKKRYWYYALHEKDLSLVVQYHCAIAVAFTDDVFVKKLLEHLRNTSDFTHYRDYVKQVKKEVEQETVSIKQQLDEIEKQSEGILATLKLPPTVVKEKTRIRLSQDHEKLLENKEALEQKLNAPARTKKVKTLLAYYDLIDKVAQYWQKYPFADRKILAEALTEQVLLDELAPHWMRIIIKWRIPHWQENYAIIYRRDGTAGAWSDAENEIIGQDYPHATRQSILEKLPKRSWAAINCQAHVLGAVRSKQMTNNSPIPPNLSYADWQFMQAADIVYSETWQKKEVFWLQSEQVEGITSFMYQLSESRRQ